MKKLQNFMLEEHALKLSFSKQQNTEKKEKPSKKKDKTQEAVADNEELQSTKLMVKNLAFESTEQDIKELFKGYGAVKKVRLPKKANTK